MVAEYMAVGEGGGSCRKETMQLQITIHFLQNTFNKYLPGTCFGMSFVSAKYGLYSTLVTEVIQYHVVDHLSMICTLL